MISAVDPFAAVGAAMDAGAAAFGVARLALAVAGLLFVLYVLSVAGLLLCANRGRRRAGGQP